MNKVPETVEQLAHKLLAYLAQTLNDERLTYAEPLTQIQGGNETYVYRFAVQGEQPQMRGPLILRLYPARFGAEKAIWESIVQRVLAGTGYPVPAVQLTCTDLSILGGAFFIMTCLPGAVLMNAPLAEVPVRLGKTHALLHQLDPRPLQQALQLEGLPADAYRFDRQFRSLRRRAAEMPWLQRAVQWLVDECPPEPATLAICHGDFHPLNILIAGDRVSAVIDWPGFMVADPALDVATTLVLITISARQLAVEQPAYAAVDWGWVGEQYLAAYRAERPLDSTNLAYYQVRRAVHALLEGTEGQMVWRQPLIVNALVAYIHHVTGLTINVPSNV